MSTQTFVLPDLGEGLTEAEVVRWLVDVGDVIVIDQAVVEVETAKSIVEVPSPYAGTVSTLHGAEGETVDVGKPLISVDLPVPTGTPIVAAPVTSRAAAGPAGPPEMQPDMQREIPTTTAAEQYREEEKAGSGNVLIGYGTSEGTVPGRRRRRPRRADALVKAPVVTPRPSKVPLVTSPLARRMAREAGLAIGDIQGSGSAGRITRSDVEAAIARAATPEAPVAQTAPTPTAPAAVRFGVGSRGTLETSHRIPMSGFRKAVSSALSRSRTEIPEATVWVDVDFTELFAARNQAKARGSETPGLLAYLARFTVVALKAYPVLNGEIDVERHELVQHDEINLGVAMQTDRGLVVPAVLGAHRLTTTQLDVELRRLTAAARAGRATQPELTAGTFTLNNYGIFNVDGSAAIIHHPQVAILGFGRIIDRAWVIDGQIVTRKIGQVSFVFDHRVCDGGTAAGFMRLVADAIENPTLAISHF